MKNKILLSTLFALGTVNTVQAQNLSGKILFSLPGTNSTTDSICTLEPDGSGFTFITHGSRPRLSPTGTYLAFLYGTDTNRSLNHIYFKDVTGAPYQYFDNGSKFNLFNFDFSPSTDKLIFDWQGGFYNQLSNDPNGQTLNNTSGAGDNFDEYPRICKVDSVVVSHNPNFGLYTMPYPGPTNGLVPNTVPGDLSPYWSPDGQWIYYAKQYPGAPYRLHNIYRIHRDGSNMQQITNLPNNDTLGMSLVVTKNGNWVVAPARINGVTGLYRFNAHPTGFDTTGQLIRAFNYLSSPTRNFWLGNVDSVAQHTLDVAVVSAGTAKIFPNPSADLVTIQIPGTSYYDLTFFNALGQKCKELTVSNYQTIRVSDIPAGLYFIELNDRENKTSQKLQLLKQ
ncbi:MAG: T9SS type A sorting domain-containing protein [Bacteroidetes bacterium]|nr:T9SS type A sorting domain-containing protein [Bacteroidota bacterium]